MILFHGCHKEAGHYWWAPGMRGRGDGYPFRRRKADGSLSDEPYDYVPWRHAVDGALAPTGPQVEGIAAYATAGCRIGTPDEEWWSALSWWDRSVDKRPGSNATFVIDQKVSPEMLLGAARAKFPEVFARMKYEIVLPKVPRS